MLPVFHAPPFAVDVCVVPRVLCQDTVCPTVTVVVPPKAVDPMSATILIVTSAPVGGATGFFFSSPLHPCIANAPRTNSDPSNTNRGGLFIANLRELWEPAWTY